MNPSKVTGYDQTLMEKLKFEWYMTRVVVKNGHQSVTCYGEIGFLA